mmetsp:Transcript_68057/g.176529  ORF Transcript_68057/g.176529 Transcript_68057/m.176529 type:complete len:250 (+) Transcript_68057:1075-1824(+)
MKRSTAGAASLRARRAAASAFSLRSTATSRSLSARSACRARVRRFSSSSSACACKSATMPSLPCTRCWREPMTLNTCAKASLTSLSAVSSPPGVPSPSPSSRPGSLRDRSEATSAGKGTPSTSKANSPDSEVAPATEPRLTELGSNSGAPSPSSSSEAAFAKESSGESSPPRHPLRADDEWLPADGDNAFTPRARPPARPEVPRLRSWRADRRPLAIGSSRSLSRIHNSTSGKNRPLHHSPQGRNQRGG